MTDVDTLRWTLVSIMSAYGVLAFVAAYLLHRDNLSPVEFYAKLRNRA